MLLDRPSSEGSYDVSPTAPLFDVTDSRLGDTIAICQIDTLISAVPDRHDICLCKDCTGMLGTFKLGIDAPALGIHVGDIVGLCPQKQMANAHTWRVIAAMEDEQSVRNRSTLQLISHAMSHDVARAANPHHAVTLFVSGPRPGPTLQPLLDPQREPLGQCPTVILFL